MQDQQFDPTKLREVLGNYPTGVVVVTALTAAARRFGMACLSAAA